eukprot:5385847-Alexandrium_andersonii.AAC.1
MCIRDSCPPGLQACAQAQTQTRRRDVICKRPRYGFPCRRWGNGCTNNLYGRSICPAEAACCEGRSAER